LKILAIYKYVFLLIVTVYCACCLANHDIPGLGHEMKPHFYVNVADIETLESEVTYIACKYRTYTIFTHF